MLPASGTSEPRLREVTLRLATWPGDLRGLCLRSVHVYWLSRSGPCDDGDDANDSFCDLLPWLCVRASCVFHARFMRDSTPHPRDTRVISRAACLPPFVALAAGHGSPPPSSPSMIESQCIVKPAKGA